MQRLGRLFSAFLVSLGAAAMLLAPIASEAARRPASIGYVAAAGSHYALLGRRLAPWMQPSLRPMVAAGLWDKLYGVIKAVVPADAIELAKFTINRPDDAASVYAHAASQDYPFFALVGAAKAARKIPKLNFDYSACIFPVTAVDTVWSTADTKISDAAGKQDTNMVIGAAQSYAKEAAKEASAQAKAEVNAQLTKTIPYFGEIVTICRFAFETNLQAEKDIYKIVSSTASDVADIYHALDDGDVVGAVKGLATLGISSGVACQLIDSALSGGMIGQVPGLTTLANGICSGFMSKLTALAAAVIELAKDFGNWAYEKGEAIYCGAKNLLGGSCGSTPPPPNAVNLGLQYCQPYGGIDHMIYDVSKSPTKPFWVECVDGHIWQHAGGSDWYSTRAAEDAKKAQALADNKKAAEAWVAAVKKGTDTEYRPRCPTGDQQCQSQLNLLQNKAITDLWFWFNKFPLDPPWYSAAKSSVYQNLWFDEYAATEEANFRVMPGRWRTDFVAFWSARCPDATCKTAMKIVGLGISLGIKQKHDKAPKLTYEQVSQPFYAEAQKEADALLEEAEDRVFNKKTTESASEGWAQLAIGAWTPKCRDQQCVDEIKSLAAQMAATAKKLQAEQPNSSALNVQGQAGKIYGPKFKAAVDASVARENLKKLNDAANGTKPGAPIGVPKGTPGPGIGKPAMAPGTAPAPAATQPAGRPAPPTAPSAGRRPAPVATPTPTPAPTPAPLLRRLPLRPVPSPSPTPTPPRN